MSINITNNFNFFFRNTKFSEKASNNVEIIMNKIHKIEKIEDVKFCLSEINEVTSDLLILYLIESDASDNEIKNFTRKTVSEKIRNFENKYGNNFDRNLTSALHYIRTLRNRSEHNHESYIKIKFTKLSVVGALVYLQHIMIALFSERIDNYASIDFDEKLYDDNFDDGSDLNEYKTKIIKEIDPEIKIDKNSIGKWLESDKFIIRVPIYQRGYEWDEQNITLLLKDIEKRVEDNKQHYFGVIAIKSTELDLHQLKQIKIIDGQQRLTTSLLIYCAVRDILNENFRLRTSDNRVLNSIQTKNNAGSLEKFFINPGGKEKDNQSFRDILNNATQKTNSNFLKNYNIIKDFFKDYEQQDILSFFKTFINNFKIGVIKFDESVYSNKDEMTIFENLNAKGKALSLIDLTKNYIFNMCSSTLLDDNELEIVKEYNSIVHDLQNHKSFGIEQFFDSIYSYTTGIEVKSKNSYTHFKQIKEGIISISNINNTEFKDIEKYKLFMDHLYDYIKLFIGLSHENHSLYEKIFGLEHIIAILTDVKKRMLLLPLSYLIFDFYKQKYGVKNIEDLEVTIKQNKHKILIKEIFIEQVKYIVRNNIIIRQGDSDLKRNIYSVINKVRSHFNAMNSLTDLKQKMVSIFDEINQTKSNNEVKYDYSKFKLSLENNTDFNKPIINLLLLTEYFISTSIKEDGEILKRKNITAEHIMPQEPSGWVENNDEETFLQEHEKHLNKIGNYLILTNMKNSKASNKKFVVKKQEVYHNLNSPLYKNDDDRIDISTKNLWTFSDITKRTEALIEYICKNVITR